MGNVDDEGKRDGEGGRRKEREEGREKKGERVGRRGRRKGREGERDREREEGREKKGERGRGVNGRRIDKERPEWTKAVRQRVTREMERER